MKDSFSAGSSPKRRPGTLRKLLIVLLSIMLAAAIFASLFGWRVWLNSGSVPPQRPPVAVAALQLSPTDVPSSIQAVGSLRAIREVMLAPETAGRVVKIEFEPGQVVDSGRLLVQLYDVPEQADRKAALARADLAKSQLERSASLLKTGATSRESVDQRTAERDQALAEVSQLAARIDQKQVRAPFSGQLGIRRIDLGQYLSPGEAIATLTDTSRLYVDFSVPQQELRWLNVGSDVRLTTDAWPDQTFSAKVDTIEPRIDPDTRNITVRAILGNESNALRPGMFVNTELLLPAQSKQLVVPVTAIQTTAFGDNVLVIRGTEATTQGQAEYVRVTTGKRFGDNVVVEGLQPGDVIVTEGQMRVPPGTPVQVKQLQTQSTED